MHIGRWYMWQGDNLYVFRNYEAGTELRTTLIVSYVSASKQNLQNDVMRKS